MNLKTFFIAALSALAGTGATASERWTTLPDETGVTLDCHRTTLPHSDDIEMAGERAVSVIYWALSPERTLTTKTYLLFPDMRILPDDTYGTFRTLHTLDFPAMLQINGWQSKFATDTITLDGFFAYKASHKDDNTSLSLDCRRFPSRYKRAYFEQYTLTNNGKYAVTVDIPRIESTLSADPVMCKDGQYHVHTTVDGYGKATIQPGSKHMFSLIIEAVPDNGQKTKPDVADEYSQRAGMLSALSEALVLETPDKEINTMFHLAKIRGSESIYATPSGLMHSPGGLTYYAAIWTNDQCEYTSPLAPFLGYPQAMEAAINSFRLYMPFMNPEYKPLPCSIIAGGSDIWDGAGDRGDAAMVAYGIGRYALSRGSQSEAEELWPMMEWCLEYTRRKLNKAGVPASDCDELERRLPAGDANLSVASQYYDALLSAAYMAEALGKPSATAKKYRFQAKKLAKAIEAHFGADMDGFHTYRYYEGNTDLRAWICMPLTVGILNRAEGTVGALFDSPLMLESGQLCVVGSDIIWDRSYLASLRAAFAAGYPDKAYPFFDKYTHSRLLGDRVPYAVEAWPENGMRHLSAESVLYCRIITEGIFGIRPIGFDRMSLTPNLPAEWDFARLKNIKAFGTTFDISIRRTSPDGKLAVEITRPSKTIAFDIANGETTTVSLAE